jgi:predicted lipoprotein with Yx(FWY)xxD motif
MSTGSKPTSRATRTSIIVVAALVALAVAVAGCGGGGGGGGYGGSSSASATPSSSGGSGPSVKLASTKLGNVLVDAKGRTLYLFEADQGPMSACSGACASIWPPLTSTGEPTAGPGVAASKLGTTERSGGATEVTYNGHPLYTYAGDSAPGQTSGQGLDDYGAEWYVLSAGGSKIDNG